MPKFSIVIPCYNSFKFMNECLKHFENQTYRDFELVIVDDFSTDDSYEQLEKYKENSKLNINLLKTEVNKGPGNARNIGIKSAKGEYITFVDSDDYIENNTLEVLNEILENDKEIDCLIYNFNFITKHNIIKKKSINILESQQYISKSDALIYVNTTTSCKVYRLKNILKNQIIFPNLMRNEDFVFNKLALSVSDKIYYYDKNLYNYVSNPVSLIHDKKYNNEKNNLIGFEMIEEKLKDKYDEELEAIFITECLYAATMNLVATGTNSKKVKEHIDYCVKKYPNIYENKMIKNINIYQRMCIFATKLKSVLLLKILIKIKKIIKIIM